MIKIVKIFGSQKGSALVLVLWVVVILGTIAAQFSYSMRNEGQAARYIKDESQAYYIAYAGISKMLYKLNTTNNNLSNDEHRVNTDIPEELFGNGEYKIKFDNESGKVNINYANKKMLDMLISHFETDTIVKDTIVDSIMDWRDKDIYHPNRSSPDPKGL